MSFALGTATGRIVLDYDGSGVTDAEKDVEGLKKKTGDAIGGLDKLGSIAGVAGGAIAAGLAVGVNAAASFEQRMSAIQAVSGATGKEFDALRDKALQLGKDTSFSAGEAGLAIEELAKAGLAVPDILNGAADATVALAAAGEIALPEAATIASNAMNQFGLAAADMPKVADLFAGAANASATGVSEIGQALQQVGAVANLAGVSLEDTTTAISLMANAGINGSDAGTSLKAMFSRLNPSTKAAKESMKELGLYTKQSGSAFYDAQGNLKNMSQISGLLQGSLKKLTREQQQQALQTIFGSDAIRAAAILAKNGSKGFDQFSKSVGKVSAADVAKTRLDNFKGSLEAMKGSLETAGIALGTIVLPALRKLVDLLTEGLNWFLNLSDSTQKWIVVALAAVSGILLLVAGIAKFIVFINTVRTALVALRGTMIATWAATLGPILLVVAAVAIVIAIIVLLWKKSETFRNIVLGVWAAIKNAAMAVADWFMGTLVPFFTGVWSAIVSAVKAAWAFVVNIVKAYITMVITIIRTVLNIIKGIWSAVWNTFGPIVKAVFGLIIAIFRLVWTIIKGIFLLAIQGIKTTLIGAWNFLKAVTSAVWNAIVAIFKAVWGAIDGVVMGAINGVKSVIKSAWDFITNVTSSMWDGFVKIISGAWDTVWGVISGIKDSIMGVFGDAGSWLLDAGKKIIQGLIDGISSMIGAVTDKINGVTDTIAKFLPGSPVKEGPLKVLNQGYAGGQIVKMLADGIAGQTWALGRQVGQVADMIPTGMALPTGGGTVVAPQTSRGPSGPFRIVGELELRNGRAYISGIAQDVVDDNEQFASVTRGMG